MTIIKEIPVTKEYKCDICGKMDVFGETWTRYTSLAHDEACPDEVPHACSDECAGEMLARIKDGHFVLPRLDSDPGGFFVAAKRQGY